MSSCTNERMQILATCPTLIEPEERAEFAAHVKSCPDCRHLLIDGLEFHRDVALVESGGDGLLSRTDLDEDVDDERDL